MPEVVSASQQKHPDLLGRPEILFKGLRKQSYEPLLPGYTEQNARSAPFCRASDKCQREKRKTINGDDLIWAMSTLGFEEYVEPLKLYLHKYREVSRLFHSAFVAYITFQNFI